MRSLSLYFTLVFATLTFALMSQTGPGGVGNTTSTGLWLRADLIADTNNTTLDTWADASNYANNAIQTNGAKRPLYLDSSALNGQPVLRFDGTNDEMAVADNDVLDGSAGLTFYVAIRPNNVDGSPRGILGKRVNYNTNSNYAYTWFFYNSRRLSTDLNTQNNRFSTSQAFNSGNNYILSLDFDGAAAAAKRAKIFSNGVNIQESTESSTSLVNSNQPLAIGALNVNYGTYLGADYAELIQFNYSLDSTEHILVQNYLSAKYNIGLNAHDLYTADETVNGDFDFDVAGIGRITSADEHSSAKGSGIIQIDNPSNLGNNEFLIWGHNGDSLKANEFFDTPAGVDARLARIWKVNEVDLSRSAVDVGTVDIQFDLSGLGAVTTSDLRFLIDTDNDGLFIDETAIDGAVNDGGSLYSFNGVSQLTNNSTFTLGTVNSSQTPLPIELTLFNARLNSEQQVVLTWETKSELNNDFFTIERSTNGKDWTVLTTVEGKGTTNQESTYEYVDQNALNGLQYYRLKQTDFDGTSTYSEVETVETHYYTTFKVYPNPTNGIVNIQSSQPINNHVMVTDQAGRPIDVSIIASGELTYRVDLSQVNPGLYFLIIDTQTTKIFKY